MQVSKLVHRGRPMARMLLTSCIPNAVSHLTRLASLQEIVVGPFKSLCPQALVCSQSVKLLLMFHAVCLWVLLVLACREMWADTCSCSFWFSSPVDDSILRSVVLLEIIVCK